MNEPLFQPLSRWAILPGDPPALKNWLLAKPAEEAADEAPDEDEGSRWREAS